MSPAVAEILETLVLVAHQSAGNGVGELVLRQLRDGVFEASIVVTHRKTRRVVFSGEGPSTQRALAALAWSIREASEKLEAYLASLDGSKAHTSKAKPRRE